jgi:hypothetical protein
MSDRTVYTFWALFNTSDYFGQDQGDSLFMKVALEQYWLHPIILWNVITRGLAYYVGLRQHTGPPSFFPFTFESGPDDFPYGSPAGMTTYTERILGQKSVGCSRGVRNIFKNNLWGTLSRLAVGRRVADSSRVARCVLFDLQRKKFARVAGLLHRAGGLSALCRANDYPGRPSVSLCMCQRVASSDVGSNLVAHADDQFAPIPGLLSATTTCRVKRLS